jgi:hypothetical protein
MVFERLHHNYYYAWGLSTDTVSFDKIVDDVSDCAKVIKAHCADLEIDHISPNNTSINSSNFTRHEIAELELEIYHDDLRRAYYKEVMEELRQSTQAHHPPMPTQSNHVKPKTDAAKIELQICLHCRLVTANDPIAFRAHQTMCNGGKETEHIFNSFEDASKFYKNNPNATTNQFRIK